MAEVLTMEEMPWRRHFWRYSIAVPAQGRPSALPEAASTLPPASAVSAPPASAPISRPASVPSTALAEAGYLTRSGWTSLNDPARRSQPEDTAAALEPPASSSSSSSSSSPAPAMGPPLSLSPAPAMEPPLSLSPAPAMEPTAKPSTSDVKPLARKWPLGEVEYLLVSRLRLPKHMPYREIGLSLAGGPRLAGACRLKLTQLRDGLEDESKLHKLEQGEQALVRQYRSEFVAYCVRFPSKKGKGTGRKRKAVEVDDDGQE